MIRAVIQYLLQAIESLTKGILALGRGMKHLATEGYKALISILEYALNGLFQGASSLFHGILWGITNIKDMVSALLQTIASFTINVLRKLGHGLGWLSSNLLQGIAKILTVPGQFIALIGSLAYSGFSAVRHAVSSLNKMVMGSFEYLYASLASSTTSLQSLMLHAAQSISSVIGSIASRTIRACMGLGNTLQYTTRFTASLLTRSLAWTIFKVLGGLTNILDVLQTTIHVISNGSQYLFKRIWAIPQAIIQALVSLYTGLNSLLSNLLAALMTQEWALASALQRGFARFFAAISYFVKSIAQALIAFATIVFFDLPRSLFETLSGALASFWSLLAGVSPNVHAMHSAAKDALSGTAGFLFLEIPRGLWNNLNTFLQATTDLVSKGAATLVNLAKSIFIDLPSAGLTKVLSLTSSAGTYTLNLILPLWNMLGSLSNKLFFGFPRAVANIVLALPHVLFSFLVATYSFTTTQTHAAYTFLKGALWGTIFILFVSLPRHLAAACTLVAHSAITITHQAFISIKNGCITVFRHLFITLPRGTFNSAKFAASHVHSGLRSTHAAVAPKIRVVHTATKRALAGTAGFLFISVPQNIFSGITYTATAFARLCVSGYRSIKNGVVYLLKNIFITIPQALWSASKHVGSTIGSGARSTHAVVTPKLINAHTATQKVLMGAAGFMFLDVPRGLALGLRHIAIATYGLLMSAYHGFKAAAFWTGTLLFITLPRTLFYGIRAVALALLSALTITGLFIQQVIRRIADFVIVFVGLLHTLFRIIGTTGRILIESILGIPRQIALAVVALASLIQMAARALWNGLVATWEGICYLATAPLMAIRHGLDRMYARAHGAYHRTVATLYEQRPALQLYAFLGAALYLGLVLFSTHTINYSKPSSQRIMAKHTVHTHATPVTVDLEIHSLQPSSEGFGCIAIEGILSYSYNTGTEPAKSIDDFSLANTRHYSLKKLSSSVNHHRVTTTRYTLAATLSPNTSTASSFPFSGSQSHFVIQNNSLSSREIHYQGTQRTLTAESDRNLGLQKILMEPGENKVLARSEHASMPELTITLEYQRWSPYILFGLYLVVFMMILMSIASLLITQRDVRLTVSGITFCLQGMMWLGCYFAGMLITVNHLMITLLIGLALNTLVTALNASARNAQSTNSENPLYSEGQFEGQTRWVLILLSMLAITLTMLIRL